MRAFHGLPAASGRATDIPAPKDTFLARLMRRLRPAPRQHAHCALCDTVPPFGERLCDSCYLEQQAAP